MDGVDTSIKKQMARDGFTVPENLATQPTLQSNLFGYLDAFYELDTERSHGIGPNGIASFVRIPWGRIVTYGEFYGYQIDELVLFIRRMDDAYIANLRQRQGNGGSSGTSQVVQRPPRPD